LLIITILNVILQMREMACSFLCSENPDCAMFLYSGSSSSPCELNLYSLNIDFDKWSASEPTEWWVKQLGELCIYQQQK